MDCVILHFKVLEILFRTVRNKWYRWSVFTKNLIFSSNVPQWLFCSFLCTSQLYVFTNSKKFGQVFKKIYCLSQFNFTNKTNPFSKIYNSRIDYENPSFRLTNYVQLQFSVIILLCNTSTTITPLYRIFRTRFCHIPHPYSNSAGCIAEGWSWGNKNQRNWFPNHKLKKSEREHFYFKSVEAGSIPEPVHRALL